MRPGDGAGESLQRLCYVFDPAVPPEVEVRVTEGAERDLAEIAGFLPEREGAALAEQMLDTLFQAAAELTHFPERGSHPRELLALGIRDFRQVLCQPYRMIHRIQGRTVFILLVADGRRDFQSLLERRMLRGQ